MSIGARLAELRARIAAACAAAGRDAAEVVLVAVSKNHPAAAVREAMAHGQTVFGENRVQELAGKARELAEAGPEWHMVGTVQTNKVKDLLAVPGLALIHSLDREKLADALQARWASARQGRGPLRCLLQVAVTGEPTKHGVPVDGARALLTHVVRDCPDLAPCGLMAMGPLDGDPRPTFTEVAALAARLRDASGLPLPVLSMGMTGDFEAAIAAGSTMVRVGTGVFGPR